MAYRFPLDPDCPDHARFASRLFDDPMTEAMGAPTDEIMKGFEDKHRAKCGRCRAFGLEHVEADC